MSETRLQADRSKKCILFDWGDTLMRVFPQYTGAMVDWPQVAPVAYALDTLVRLQPLALLAVATNAKDSGEAEIWDALKRASLADVLDYVFCFHSIGYLKPSLEYYAHILKQLQLPAEQVIMVGDEWIADIQGANQAGLRAVWFNPRTLEERANAQHLTIHSLVELPDSLHKWGFL